MGILHADQKRRDSFVFDVIEPLRPVVDGQLLTLLERRSFGKREFFETRQGACRLMPPLPQVLAKLAHEGEDRGPGGRARGQAPDRGAGNKEAATGDPDAAPPSQPERGPGWGAARRSPSRPMTAPAS